MRAAPFNSPHVHFNKSIRRRPDCHRHGPHFPVGSVCPHFFRSVCASRPDDGRLRRYAGQFPVPPRGRGEREKRCSFSGTRISCARPPAAWSIPGSFFPTRECRFLKAPCRDQWRPLRFPPPAFPPRTGTSRRIETVGNSAAEALPVMALLPEGRRFLYTKGEIVCFYRLKR